MATAGAISSAPLNALTRTWAELIAAERGVFGREERIPSDLADWPLIRKYDLISRISKVVRQSTRNKAINLS